MEYIVSMRAGRGSSRRRHVQLDTGHTQQEVMQSLLEQLYACVINERSGTPIPWSDALISSGSA